MKNLRIVENPIIQRDMTTLRDKNTSTYEFRMALRRISYAMAVEISKTFKVVEKKIETPLEVTKGYVLDEKIIIIPVLRAGLSLVDSFLEMIPSAKVGHIGLQRDEKTLLPKDYYYKTPVDLPNSRVIVLDVMLATGGSASAAVNSLKQKGAKNCMLVCLIAAPEGVKKMENDHPDILIYTSTLDRELNEHGYILPGLGDAGDRTFGTY